jgi:ApaG protein
VTTLTMLSSSSSSSSGSAACCFAGRRRGRKGAYHEEPRQQSEKRRFVVAGRYAALEQRRRRRARGMVVVAGAGASNGGDDVRGSGDAVGGSTTTYARDPSLRRRMAKTDEALRDAVLTENYALASKLRDELRELRREDPFLRVEDEMRACVEAEDYAGAAAKRDLLDEMEREARVASLAPTESDKTTRGIRITTRSTYVSDRSSPRTSQYYFQYVIRITNVDNDKRVKLLSRNWLVTDADGRAEAVRGAGVVGQQPVLSKGQTFEYASACPLRTSRGTMEGFYRFVELEEHESGLEHVVSELAPEDAPGAFNVEIAQFGLDAIP